MAKIFYNVADRVVTIDGKPSTYALAKWVSKKGSATNIAFQRLRDDFDGDMDAYDKWYEESFVTMPESAHELNVMLHKIAKGVIEAGGISDKRAGEFAVEIEKEAAREGMQKNELIAACLQVASNQIKVADKVAANG